MTDGRAPHDASLAPAEAQAYLDVPITAAERENVLTLVRWFRARYVTPADRLAYVRRAYARWLKTTARAGREGP